MICVNVLILNFVNVFFLFIVILVLVVFCRICVNKFSGEYMCFGECSTSRIFTYVNVSLMLN